MQTGVYKLLQNVLLLTLYIMKYLIEYGENHAKSARGITLLNIASFMDLINHCSCWIYQ